jgi:copper transporter 1
MSPFSAFSLLIYMLLVSIAGAMDMSGSSSSSSNSSSELMEMMVPYLHFTGGDYLFFGTVAPTSNGAIAGACIFLAVLAILERAVAGARGIFALHVPHRLVDSTQHSVGYVTHRLHHYFRQRALFRQGQSARPTAVEKETSCSEGNLRIEVSTVATGSQVPPAFNIKPLSAQRQRTMTPFLWRYELVRGGLFIVQSFFVYVIMLAVM